jgi:2-polyprenyl-3-methyl-5-hydroxy-6-metoxy-1,4-benzoquinol methylase
MRELQSQWNNAIRPNNIEETAMTEETVEPQYNDCLKIAKHNGVDRLGLMANYTWNTDPKRLCFVLSRYKFVAKMLDGMQNVLEIGSADAFGTRIVQQAVANVTATDFDPVFIDDVNQRQNPKWHLNTLTHDMLSGPLACSFDAAYALDVLEHIEPHCEQIFLKNVSDSLKPKGVAIFGMPSLESQIYASPGSRAGHVNCKNGTDLKKCLEKFFDNVFVFCMNDETLHTGYFPMAHYLLALCCGPIQRTTSSSDRI